MKRYSDFEKKFGEKVTKLREDRGLTQEGLAHLAGVTQAQVSRLESGVRGTTLTTIINVAVALGHDPKLLFDIKSNLVLNSNFEEQRQRNPVVPTLLKFINQGGLNTPKKVSEILEQIYKDFEIEMKSSSVSRALEELVKKKILSKNPAEKGRIFLYNKIN